MNEDTQYEISNEVAAVLLFLLRLLLLPILSCPLSNSRTIARLSSTIILRYLLRLHFSLGNQTSYLLLYHCGKLLKVLFRICKTCRVHETMLSIFYFHQFYSWITLIQLLCLLQHRSIAKILHFILTPQYYLRLCSDQLGPHSLKWWQTIEHECHIHHIQKFQHFQANRSSHRKTNQHYLLSTLSCILTYRENCLCYFLVIETCQEGEVIALLIITSLVIEETGNHDRLLVVSDLLYHETQVILESVVFMEPNDDAG